MFRDAHILDVIQDGFGASKQMFVVYGSVHAVMLESVIWSMMVAQ
jgi:hypothetical protein